MSDNLYNILLTLSRNKFFYEKIKLPDTFETRIYLMFIHFSLLMIITKKKGKKFDQKIYDLFFHNIEYNLRELGDGDVAVNKKMKNLTRIFYDILLTFDKSNTILQDNNYTFLKKYFLINKKEDNKNIDNLSKYFDKFKNFCFDLDVKNMLNGSFNFIYK